MKKFLLFILMVFTALAGILIYNTVLYSSKQSFLQQEKIEVDTACVRKLAESVRIKTISYDDDRFFDSSAFVAFHQFLLLNFPLSDSLLEKEIISKYSLLYKWKGKNESLKPVILLAHSDVVPAEGKWEEDAFSGLLKNGFIWGRGTLDDKVAILGILEATEKLLKENFRPERTIYFAFGHDEEIMGKNGASKIASLLKSRKIEAEFILDEGLVLTEGIVPGIEKKVALIGVAEKGYLTLKLTAEVEGGHGSMPAKENSIGVISKAIVRIQENSFPAQITKPVEVFLDYVGPEMPFLKKIIFANRWLFQGLVINAYEQTPSGNALIRTTVSPTIFTSGIKDNVIPETATAILNVRTLPGRSHEEVVSDIRSLIGDERIKIEVLTSLNPSPVSSVDAAGFKTMEKTIRQIFPDTYVAPSLMIAGTDSKHYAEISPNIYRFLPVRLRKEDLGRIHGSNERIKEEDYKNLIRFYYQLMKNIK